MMVSSLNTPLPGKTSNLHAVSQEQLSRGQPSRTQLLPAWPITWGLSGFGLWWITGFGDLIWIIAAAIMVHYLLAYGRSRIRVPRGFGVWLFFLATVAASALMLDSGGRAVGFTQRALMYLSITVIFVYAYQHHQALTLVGLARAFTWFWILMVMGGFAGLFMPEFELRTPLALLLPHSLLQNELVSEMAFRRFTQFNPESWAQQWPRPAAPFLYSNGWGLGYALLTPIVIGYLPHAKKIFRVVLLLLLPLSLIPAGLSLNRGMFIGLGVAAVVIMLWAVYHRNWPMVTGLGAALGAAAVILATLPVFERLEMRLETSSTTTDRFLIYREAIERTAHSPIVGYGAPRPSLIEGLPSTGTQGQVWMVMFSHGFLSIAAFAIVIMGLAVICLRHAWRSPQLLKITVAVAVLDGAIGMFYYSLLNTTFVIIAAGAAVLLREKDATS